MKAAALPGARDQVLDHQVAGRVAQVPPVVADPVRLLRMHQVGALEVVDKEVAVRPIGQRIEDLAHPLLGDRVVGRGAFVDVADRGLRQAQVVEQLRLLGVEHAALEGGDLLLGQTLRLVGDQQADRRDCQDQRHGGEQQDFLPQVHVRPCLSRRRSSGKPAGS